MVAVVGAKTEAFFGREKLLLDLSGESMKALRVRLGDQVGQLYGAGFAEFLGRRAFLQTVPSGQRGCRGVGVAKWT